MKKVVLYSMRVTSLLLVLFCSTSIFGQTVTVNTYTPSPAVVCRSSSATIIINGTVASSDSGDYYLEVSTSPGFGTILLSGSGSPVTLNFANSYTANISLGVGSGNVTAANGTYYVRATNTGNTVTSATQIFYVATPVPGFSVNDSTQCLGGNSFLFTNTSTIVTGSMTYHWDFGDGTTSNAISPTKTYGVSGVYPVKLVCTSNMGCKDSITQYVNVYAQPMISFAAQGLACASKTYFVNATTISAGSIVSYLWNYGDTGTSQNTLANPSHRYAVGGAYNVKLVATSNMGCSDSLTQSTSISYAPIADFTRNYTSLCLSGNAFLFTNTSQNGPPSSWIQSSLWDFGDATTSTATFPNPKSYSASGVYDVRLVVFASNGCNDTIVKQVTVVKPNVAFAIAAGSCGTSVTFTNSTTVVGGGSATYFWNFGDGGTSTSATPTHVYSSLGTYTVKLYATTVGLGCIDSLSQTFTIGVPPVAGYSHSVSCNSLVSFTDTSTGVVSRLWDFGDASTSTLANPTHGYAGAGTYSVKLVVTNSVGCKDSVTKMITVAMFTPKPVAKAYHVVTGCNTATVYADSSSFATTYDIFYYDPSNISLGGLAGVAIASGTPIGPIPSTNYGIYKVVIVAHSALNSCTDTTTHYVTFTNNPVPGFSTSTNSCTNAVTFISSSTVNFGALTYLWDFGDASTSTAQTPSHSYGLTGSYNVKLVATSVSGCKDSITQSVAAVAGNNNPVPGFSYALASGSCTNKYQFTNTSSGGAVSYLWNFGDGNTSTFVNPTHAYAYVGTYTVKLIAYTSGGCSDSTTQTITVTGGQYGPAASFTPSSTNMCLSGNSFNFYNGSAYLGGTGWIPYYYWDFGDGTYSYNTFVFNKTYASSGSYLVKLIAVANDGCTDTAYATISVGTPNVSFNVSGSSCSNTITFNNTTTTPGNPSVTYLWKFGDGGTSTSTSPVHVYSTTGSYNVTLIATSVGGCVDSIVQTIYVGNNVVAGFSHSTLCDNSKQFMNTSLNAATYLWDFGDASTSTLTNPSHAYAGAGTYSVKLVATSVYGCKDSITILVSASAAGLIPDAVATYNTIGCNSVSLHANTSINTDSVSWFAYNASNTLAMSVNKISKNDSVGLSPVLLYGSGLYTIKLVAYSNSSACPDTAIIYVNFAGNPTASFTHSTNPCNNAKIFTNTSTNGSTYFWTFGDAGTSTSFSPSHGYASAGTYTVGLTVTGPSGCVASTSQSVSASTFGGGPAAGFTYSVGSTSCVTNRVYFTNTSTGASTYLWIFGDGKGATTSNAANTYALAGTYTVKLVAMIGSSCSDTATTTIILGSNAAGVVALPGVNAQIQCVTDNNYIYPNYSYHTVYPRWVQYYSWNLGDGSPLDFNNHVFNKHYTTAGNYTVTLVATDDIGCRDTASFSVTVQALPCGGSIMKPIGGGDKDDVTPGDVDKATTGLTSLSSAAGLVGLYPNPNNGNFTIKFGEIGSKEVTISIVDMLGRTIITQRSKVKSSVSLDVNDSGMENGTYHLLISDSGTGNIITSKSFVVTR